MIGAFPSFAFAAPAMLGFLGVLPLVWWLLRLTPPAPRKVAFPALELLRGLIAREEVPAQTPWWLLILRLAILALAILAFAQPQLNPPPETATPNDAPLHSIALLVIDNDWASARDWPARQKAMLDYINQAEKQSFMLLPTTRSPDDAPIAIIGPLDALSAQAEIKRLAPQPWPADWQGAAQALARASEKPDAIEWLASGTGGAEAQAFYKELQEKTSHLRALETGTPIQLLQPPQREDNATILPVLRLDPIGANLRGAVIAYAQDGRALARLPYAFAEGSTRAIATLDVPTELRNHVASFALEGQRGAGAVILLDGSWAMREIGIVGDEGEGERRTLLSGVYYLQRALSPYATLRYGALSDLLKHNPAMIVLPETAEPAEAELKPLQEWIAHGGILLRFAGTRLSSSVPSHAQSELLPVPLRVGGRAMGGALSWDKPKKLGTFPQSSPFAGLAVPDEVTINRQILAEPSPALAAHTWATLEDGTPLVTAKKIGQGQTILFHVPARPDGSNLPLSGTFVSMLRRIVEQTQTGSMAAERKTDNLRQSEPYAPLRVLDGFGETQSPDAAALAAPENDWPALRPSPRHPPGLYGKGNVTRAFNLGGEGNKLLEAPQGIPFKTIQNAEKSSRRQTVEFKPWILSLAMALMLLDFAITLWLRGIVMRRWSHLRRGLLSIMLASLLLPSSASANSGDAPVSLTARTWLAYVRTGDRATDSVSEAGLNGLALELAKRTSATNVEAISIDLSKPANLAYYALIYWPLTARQKPLTHDAAQSVNEYLGHGGVILFDVGDNGALGADGNDISPATLRHLFPDIDIPPLQSVPKDHVLTKSFYLLDSFPGRADGKDFWIMPEEEVSTQDGVPGIFFGANGWAAAWAVDSDGARPLYPCYPGGEAQREMAYRFGINLVMVALSGNYKADQVHAKALLDRMGR